ncbi:predicted protein [Arabidopsis lyrata subsp. lyrata]|uniref:Predicted protein n=1 Tax=Arabidopsis lyrata subsp. lyrata TaxID=81972 RepID=D7L3H8_ARALL|nr:predicted protein [Arabidopsis lyrata subsp. lyrata]
MVGSAEDDVLEDVSVKTVVDLIRYLIILGNYAPGKLTQRKLQQRERRIPARISPSKIRPPKIRQQSDVEEVGSLLLQRLKRWYEN